MPADPFADECDDMVPMREPLLPPPREPRRRPVDRVTVRALHFALDGVPERDHMIGELITTAQGNRATLARALQRLYTRSEGRTLSTTAIRAAALVRAALDRATAARDVDKPAS